MSLLTIFGRVMEILCPGLLHSHTGRDLICPKRSSGVDFELINLGGVGGVHLAFFGFRAS
jgi:hypothetical protein